MRLRSVHVAWVVLWLLPTAGMLASLQAQTAPPGAAFTFVVLGDMPYTTPEVDRDAAFGRLIAAINRLQPAFSIHVGDLKSGSTRCDDALFTKLHAVFQTFAQPLIYTPGDNDWTDCHRKNNGPFEPLERLAAIRKQFFPAATSLGKTSLALTRQSDVSPFQALVENARWSLHGVLFTTVHVVGSNNNLRQDRDAALEFIERNKANLVWIREAFHAAQAADIRGLVLAMQADPGFNRRHGDGSGFQETLEVLTQQAAELGKPVLLVHGDSHEFIIDQPLRHPDGKRLLDNVIRLEVFGEPRVHAVRVLVQPQDPMLFAFQPLFVPENMEMLRR